MKVREITAADRAGLAGLLSGIEQFTADEVAVALELIDAAIRDPRGSGYSALVAQAAPDGPLLGYVCVGPTPMTEASWDLYWIAVDAAQQGRGIGRALYDAAVERIVSAGGRQLRIETSSQESYAKTGGFYQRLGFPIAGRLPDFYAPGDDLLIFYRQIA